MTHELKGEYAVVLTEAEAELVVPNNGEELQVPVRHRYTYTPVDQRHHPLP